MILVEKLFQVAFGCSIRYSWAFRCRYHGRSPRKLRSIYRCPLCLPWAWHSAALSASTIPSISSSHPLSTIFFIRCKKFLISSPSPRTQCSTSILCRNMFRVRESCYELLPCVCPSNGILNIVFVPLCRGSSQ